MNGLVKELRLRSGRTAKAQITDHLRELIIRGDVAEGQRLPSTQDLAKKWGAHVTTVHAAMTTLTKEGLVDRVMRQGTFVSRRVAKLECVGTYFDATGWNGQQTFVGALMHALGERLATQAIRLDPWIDHRPLTAMGQPWAELREAAVRRQIQGLIVVVANAEEVPWLNDLPVPVAFVTMAGIANRVNIQEYRAFPAALRVLAAQGCRSVGLISAWSQSPANVPGSFGEYTRQHYAAFRSAATEHNLEVREEWIYSPPGMLGENVAGQFGYDSFMSLWNQAGRPDGLLVDIDTVAKGVLTGLLARQVKVPQDLKLVLHRNAELGFVCPVPATFLEVPVGAVAQGLIDLIASQSRGVAAQPIVIVPQVVTNETNISPFSGPFGRRGEFEEAPKS